MKKHGIIADQLDHVFTFAGDGEVKILASDRGPSW